MSAGLSVLKALASGCTIAMFLSSAPAIHNIHKAHDTGEVALFPLVGLWLNSHMAMLYGIATANYFPFFTTFAFGTLLATLYVGVYFRWTAARSYAAKSIGTAFVAIAIGSTYTALGLTGVTGQSTEDVGSVVGYVVTFVSLLPYVGPFETIKTVLKTRSGASIPVGMCLAGAAANALWTVYGLIIRDPFVYANGGACMVVGLAQVTLYVVFWPERKASGPRLSEVSPLSDSFTLPANAPPALKAAGSLKEEPSKCRANKLDAVSPPAFVQICSPP